MASNGYQGQAGYDIKGTKQAGYDIHPGTHNLDFNNGRKLMTHTRDMDRLVNDIKGLRAPLLLSGRPGVFCG